MEATILSGLEPVSFGEDFVYPGGEGHGPDRFFQNVVLPNTKLSQFAKSVSFERFREDEDGQATEHSSDEGDAFGALIPGRS